MIKVFYDGKCGLCSKEINHYKKISPKGIFDWIDITKCNDLLEDEGLDFNDTLRLLHAKDNYGKLHIGVDAFILIWRQLRYWKILAALTSLPMIRQIANTSYKVFANWKFKRISYCKTDFKNGENK